MIPEKLANRAGTKLPIVAALIALVGVAGSAVGSSAGIADAAVYPSGWAMPGALSGWTQTYANDFVNGNLNAFQVYNGQSGDPGVCWAASHDVISGGVLDIKGYADPGQLANLKCSATSTEYVTGGLKLTAISQTYGFYEIRARIESGQGVSVAAQLWPTDNDWNNGIVFMEDNGAAARTSNLATEYSSSTPTINHQSLSVDMTKWHTYGVIWKPGSIDYQIDGKQWGSVTSADLPDIPLQLAIQTESWRCGANNWEQCVSPSSPAEIDMDVDWIVAYAPGSRQSAQSGAAASATKSTRHLTRSEGALVSP